MAARSNTAASRAAAEQEKQEAAEQKKAIVPKEVDIHQYIPVKNGFHGLLVYISKRTGEEFQWENFGDEQEMELQELKNAKSSDKAFFQNNWFLFDEEYAWVIDYLGMRQFYKNALSIDGFDDILKRKPEEIKKEVAAMSSGQKASLRYHVIEKIANDEIDSRKVIAALEEALGVQLVE